MAKQKLIKRIDTVDGPLQIDYKALANLPDIEKLEKDVEALKTSQVPESTIEELNKEVRKLEASIGYAATDPDKTFAEVIDETFVKKTELEEILEDLPAGGGGASSWNDLTDKPFGENSPESITYDGNTDGKVVNSRNAMIKVSDKILTKEDVVGGTIIGSNGYSITVTEEDVVSGGGGISFCDAIISVADINNTSDIAPGETYPETGTYFAFGDDFYIQSLTLAGGSIKTLDEKFIPDTIARKADVVVEWGKF
jgi:hypothetical protein